MLGIYFWVRIWLAPEFGGCVREGAVMVEYSRLKIFDRPGTPTELGQKNGYQQERNMECPKDLAV